jgi:hypothetical protein
LESGGQYLQPVAVGHFLIRNDRIETAFIECELGLADARGFGDIVLLLAQVRREDAP